MLCFLAFFVFLTNFESVISVRTHKCNSLPCLSRHTVCKYPYVYSKKCPNFKGLVFSRDEKHRIVKAHDLLRGSIAKGEAGLPKAAYMPKLIWNVDLEVTAKVWADQCNFSRDECRDTGHIKVGQTHYLEKAIADNLTMYIESFFEKAKKRSITQSGGYVRAPKAKGEDFEEYVGNVQMLSATVGFVGCGMSINSIRGGNLFWFVCNYSPVNSFEKTDILYEIGEPCSKCLTGMTCHRHFTSLCVFQNTEGFSSVTKPTPQTALALCTLFLLLFVCARVWF